MKNKNGETTTEPFVLIRTNDEVFIAVIKILKDRLPRSPHVYNMALGASSFPTIKAYSLNGDLSKNGIFVLIDNRPDFPQDINVSVPLDFQVSESVKESFLATSIIDWTSQYWFPALDRLISQMIFEISFLHKKNSTTMNPSYYYFMSDKDAANLELKWPSEVEVKPLNLEQGAELITKGWKFCREGTAEFVKDIVKNGTTAGVYVDGNPVCGIIQNKNGYIGMLFTAKNHRNKGYAKICTQFLMKQLGRNGFVVASTVECQNLASNEFHKKLGMEFIHMADDVIYEKGNFAEYKVGTA